MIVPGNEESFPFWIPTSELKNIGKLVEESRATVPVTFASKWVDPIKYSGGNRAVDYVNLLLYILPTSFVPAFKNDRAKKPVLNLVKACAFSLKWELTSQNLRDMQR